MTPTRIDHRLEGYNRLLEVFKDKPNIKAMIEIYLKQNDDLEDVIFQVLNSRHLSEIDSVIGGQLDVIGNIIGQDRNDLSDIDYRKAIILRIGVNNSQATPNYITNLLKDTTESTDVKYFPHYPASYIAEFNGDEIPSNFLLEFQNATAAGVNAGFIHNKNDEGWVCCEVGSVLPLADKSILPEYTALSGTSASEIYMENANPPAGLPAIKKGDKLRQAFAITEHLGDSTQPLNIDVGLDLTSSESMLIYWNSFNQGYVYNYSPSFPLVGSGTGSTRQWYGGSRLQSSTTLTTQGFSEPANAPITWLNQTGVTNYVHSFKSVPEVLEIFEYTGDGTLSQTVSHTLGKKPLYMAIQKKNQDGVVYWYKGMEANEAFSSGDLVTIGAILGGAIPTSTEITVGDIGGSNNPNADGVEYVVLLLADNPDEGITAGSYMSTGVEGQEVVIGNEVGYLNIQRSQRQYPIMYSKETGLKGRVANLSQTSTGSLQAININSDTVVLGADNVYTNSSSLSKYYWFNVADPDSTIN